MDINNKVTSEVADCDEQLLWDWKGGDVCAKNSL
jgi:hypothetical protein